MSSGIDDRQAPGFERAARRRCDEQHGLFLVADALCTLQMTDGFCTPKNRDACECWKRAERAMEATGFSGRALAWIFAHRDIIERTAAKDA